MALSLFKSNEPVPTERPARAALHAHIDIDQGIVKQIETINQRMRTIDADIRRHDDIGSQILALRDTIATASAEAVYHSRPVRDLSAERKRLTELENALPAAADAARIAQVLKPKLTADTHALLAKRKELKPTTQRLLWEATVEEGASHLEEYMAAREAMIAVAHKTFGAFLAADTIAKENSFGTFCGSALYGELYIPLPNHPAYRKDLPGPEEAQRQRNADAAYVGEVAGDLVNKLLNGPRA